LTKIILTSISFLREINIGYIRSSSSFIDTVLGAHSMLTEIAAYNNGKLIKVGNEKVEKDILHQ
jgi:hypothetical protein